MEKVSELLDLLNSNEGLKQAFVNRFGDDILDDMDELLERNIDMPIFAAAEILAENLDEDDSIPIIDNYGVYKHIIKIESNDAYMSITIEYQYDTRDIVYDITDVEVGKLSEFLTPKTKLEQYLLSNGVQGDSVGYIIDLMTNVKQLLLDIK